MSRLAPGHVFFAADVHWRPAAHGDAEPTGLFGRFLADLAERAHGGPVSLYVLGDLFDFWFEQRGRTFAFYEPHLLALEHASRAGVRISLLDGNRDFTYGLLLPRRCGVTLHGEKHAQTFGSLHVQMQHGDKLCTGDWRYQAYRRVVRSEPVRAAMGLATLTQVEKLVGWMRRASEVEIRRKDPASLDVSDKAVVRELERGHDVVICGHVHRAQRRVIVTELGKGELVILGTWGTARGSYATCVDDTVTLHSYA